MYTRVTTFGINPEHFAESDALAETIVDDVMAIPGMKNYYRARDDDGNAVTIAVYETKEAAEVATETIKGLFGKFVPFMSSPPQAAGYEVFDHSSNG